MLNACRGLRTVLLVNALVCVLINPAVAQVRGGGGSGETKETPPPPGVDPLFWKLTKVKDRSIKAAAERYVALVRIQEWSDASGKFKTLARYVKHEPDLTMVTIEIVRGRGTEQTKEQKAIPVEKLSKQCQTRVRQIDASQKNLKEWATAHPEEVGDLASLGGESGALGTGTPMNDEVGAMPNPETPPAVAATGPEAGNLPPAVPTNEPDPSASDPDPLGFAELPPVPGPTTGGEPPPPGG